jgi:hypothetical protein
MKSFSLLPSHLLCVACLVVPACGQSVQTRPRDDGRTANTADDGVGGMPEVDTADAQADTPGADAGRDQAGTVHDGGTSNTTEDGGGTVADANNDDAAGSDPIVSRPTVLGQLAAQMKPGELQELETEGYTGALVFAQYGDELDELGDGVNKDQIYNYSNKGAWDPETRQFFFLGLGHYAALKFISYSERDNKWTLMPVPPWADPRVTNDAWPRSHAYSKNVVDVERRLFLFFGLARGVRRYHIDQKRWLGPLPYAEGMPLLKDANAGGTVFPELGGWVRFWLGQVHLYSHEKESWSKLGENDGVAMHALIEYSSKAKVAVYGGGREPPALYAIDTAGTFSKVAQPPAALPFIGTHTQVFVPDPVSGEFIVGNMQDPKQDSGDPHLFALDVKRNAWKRLSVEIPRSRYLIAAAIPNHDVIMFCGAAPAKVWLYKHKSPWL